MGLVGRSAWAEKLPYFHSTEQHQASASDSKALDSAHTPEVVAVAKPMQPVVVEASSAAVAAQRVVAEGMPAHCHMLVAAVVDRLRTEKDRSQEALYLPFGSLGLELSSLNAERHWLQTKLAID